MKPKYNCKGQREASVKWYNELEFLEKVKVDKMVKNYQKYVSGKSITQASKANGIELVYSVRERIMK